MATGKRRRNTFARLIEDVVDDATDLLHDPDRRDHSAQEMDNLKSALDELTAKVNRLVAMQAEGRKPS